METKQWTFRDVSQWGPGPWASEPDKMQWTDEATGLPCLAVRHPSSGHWCGYVGVTEDHPLFGIDDSAVDPNPSVHGGLTFAGFCAEDKKEHGICHIPGEGEPDRVWWLGLDCGHAWDVSPRDLTSDGFDFGGSYKNLAFVRDECRCLAAQFAETPAR
jgi:hypothetical protein